MSADERGGPAEDRPTINALALDDDTASIAQTGAEWPARRRRCRHLRAAGPCRLCRHERIHAQIELERIAPVHGASPSPSPSPQTFGLSTAELTREANRLYAMGVPIAEIQQLLAVPLPDCAA